MNKTATVENAALESLLGQVADEFADRLNRGEQPDIEEYARLHPQLAEPIRRMLPTIQIMCHLSVDSASPADPQSPAAGDLGDFRIIREIGRGGMRRVRSTICSLPAVFSREGPSAK